MPFSTQEPRAALRSSTRLCDGPCEHAGDASIELFVKEQLDVAFDGIQGKLAEVSEEEAMDLIKAQADVVMRQVLDQVQLDGKALEADLMSQIESSARSKGDELMLKYEA